MIVSYAIVRDDPPELFLADDIDTLQWVLALQLVAQSRPRDLPENAVRSIRDDIETRIRRLLRSLSIEEAS